MIVEAPCEPSGTVTGVDAVTLKSGGSLKETDRLWESEPRLPVTTAVVGLVDRSVHDSVAVAEVARVTLPMGLHVRSDDEGAMEKEMVPVKPLTGATVIVEVPW